MDRDDSMAGNPFGHLLRTLRVQERLSQAELGRGFCTRAHVSAIETGSRAPSGFVVRHFLERLPARRALAEALVASYPPRPDWIHAGIALALWGETDGARVIFAALAGAGPQASASRHAGHGTRALGWSRYLEGHLEEALQLLRASVERHRRASQFREAAWALWELGMMVTEAAPGPEAIRCFHEARRAWGRRGGWEDQRFQAIVLHSEARALQRIGWYRRAQQRAAEAARFYRAIGDPVGEGHALLEEAHAAHDAGALDRCRLLADQALERFIAGDHQPCLGVAELAAAIALIDQGPGRVGEAALRLRTAEELLAQSPGDRTVYVLSERARLAFLQGDQVQARAIVERALQQPAPALERAHQLCLAAAVGLQEWPQARQTMLRLSRAFSSPWERHTYLRSTARLCTQLSQWRWAAELYHAGETWWEAWWDPPGSEGSVASTGVSR